MDNLDEIVVERFIAGECSEVEMQRVLDWFKASEENRKEWLKLRMVSAKRDFVRFSEPEHVDRSYRELLKERGERETLERKIARKITLRFLRYAASILLLMGVSYAVYLYVSYQEPVKMVVVAVGGNEPVREIRLGDSTRVWLSAGSQIEYPERFDKEERKVSVEGKVYFEVAADTNRPFWVSTETYMVKVVGTSFEVNTFRFRQMSDVTLIEGKVEILDRELTSLCLMQPGQQFEIDKLTNSFVLHEVAAEMVAAWHDGKLEFDGLTFAEIAKALERQYNVRIILEEGIVPNQKLVGSLSFQKDIYEMMRTIALVIPIEYNVQMNTVVVHIQPKSKREKSEKKSLTP